MSREISSKILVGCHVNKIEANLTEAQQVCLEDYGSLFEYLECEFTLDSCSPYYDSGDDVYVGFEILESDDVDKTCRSIQDKANMFEALFGFKPFIMSCPDVS